MNVPKWLIPVMSIVAALAVGIAAALIGVQFAAPVVAEQPAVPVVAPVIAPIATGLTHEQTQELIRSGDAEPSQVVGSRLVTPPSDLPISQGVEEIFHELALGGADTPADGSSGSGAPAATAEPTADDPCSTTDGSTPDGCPDGLHSAIFALTAVPDFDFALYPFGEPCGTAPIPVGSDGMLVNVPLLIDPTVPATYDVWVSPETGSAGRFRATGLTTDPALVIAWELARATDTPAESLPDLSLCVIIPNIPVASVNYISVTGHRPGSDDVVHTVGFNAQGPRTPQGLQIRTYGGNGFIAYVDHPVEEQIAIRAYTGATAGTASCDNTRGLTDLSNVTGDDSTFLHALQDNDPEDYVYRYVLGYIVPAGSTVLVCAKWYNGRGSPSWDLITPLRTDSAVVESPDAILPEIRAQAINGYHYPGSTNVVVSAETVEGSGCGLRSVTLYDGPDYETDFTQRLLCAVQGTGAAPTGGPYQQWMLREAGFSGDIAIHTTVNWSNGTAIRDTKVLPTSENRPRFCDDTALDCGNDSYLVEIPGYAHSETGDGLFAVEVTWVKVGRSGLSSWRISPSVFETPEQPADPSTAAPLLDTHYRISPAFDGVSNGISAGMYLQVNTPADYEVHLVGLRGEPPCSHRQGPTAEPLTASGHVDSATGINIQGLCYGAQYWATITLTNEHGTTVWGYDNPGSGWLSNLMTTPRLSVDVQFTATLAVPDGDAATAFDLQIDRQELDPAHPLTNGCVATPITNTGTTTMQLGSYAQLHIQYQLHPRAPGSGCSVTPGDTTPMGDVFITLPLAEILANPDGYHVASGPVDLIVRIAPTP